MKPEDPDGRSGCSGGLCRCPGVSPGAESRPASGAPKGRPKFRDDPHPQTTDLDRLEGRRLRGVRTKGDRNDWVRWPLDRLRGRVYLHDHVCVGATGGPAEALDDRLVASPESQHKPGGDLGRGFLDPFQGELGVEEDVHLGRQRQSLHCPHRALGAIDAAGPGASVSQANFRPIFGAAARYSATALHASCTRCSTPQLRELSGPRNPCNVRISPVGAGRLAPAGQPTTATPRIVRRLVTPRRARSPAGSRPTGPRCWSTHRAARLSPPSARFRRRPRRTSNRSR